MSTQQLVVPDYIANFFEAIPHELGHKINALSETRNKDVIEWVEEVTPREAHIIFAKMEIFGYIVEDDVKYYWRKKSEYLTWFEEQGTSKYLNVHKDSNRVILESNTEKNGFQVTFTQKEALYYLDESFYMFEKVLF